MGYWGHRLHIVLAALMILSTSQCAPPNASGSAPTSANAQASGDHSPGPTGGARSAYDHIFVIVEENTEFPDLLGNPELPTLNDLAQRFGQATSYYGVAHPSEPNYVALVGGNTYDIADDEPYPGHQIANPSLVDEFEQAGLTWKGYFQSLPAAGFAGTCAPSENECRYASKHNGFLNFTHVSGDPTELAKLVPDTVLGEDLVAGRVPNLSFIVPDQCHDLHGLPQCPDSDANRAAADRYLGDTVTAITRAAMWTQGRNAIVITFDEGTSNAGCCDAIPGGGQVLTVVVTNRLAGPLLDPTPANHYALVATIEQAFGLGCVGLTCDTAQIRPLAALFGLGIP